MSFGRLAALWAICTIVFFALDFAWIATATSRLYQPFLGKLLSEKPNLAVAGVFYLVYVVGIVALAVVPSLQDGNVLGALWRGALLGLLAYATYALTNLSTIQGWPWRASSTWSTWWVSWRSPSCRRCMTGTWSVRFGVARCWGCWPTPRTTSPI